jgi:hypothetical protein
MQKLQGVHALKSLARNIVYLASIESPSGIPAATIH